MSRTKTDRRTVLRTLGLSAAAAPLIGGLPSLTVAKPAGPRKCFLAWYTPMGGPYDQWRPSGEGANYELSEVLEPLKEYKKEMLVLDRLSITAVRRPGHIRHQRGMIAWLTGYDMEAKSKGAAKNSAEANYALGPSVDQVIVQGINEREGASFKSLVVGGIVEELGCNDCELPSNRIVSFKAAKDPVFTNADPYQVFDNLFGGAGQDPAAAERRRFLRKSVLDGVQRDIVRLQQTVSAEDRALLQKNADSLRAIEVRLTEPGIGAGAACNPSAPQKIDYNDMDNFALTTRLQVDMIVQAFACDLTRVAVMQYGHTQFSKRYPDSVVAGGAGSHHGMAHDQNIAGLVKVARWYNQELAYLASQLKAHPHEEFGNLLNASVVHSGSCLSNGLAHRSNNMQFVQLGSGGGYLKTGEVVRFNNGTDKDESSDSDRSNSDLFQTYLQAFGLPGESFGNPKFNQGQLSAIIA